MKKHYHLYLLQGACFLFISLLLQNCGGSSNLPIQGEEREQLKREGQVSIIGGNQEQENNPLPTIMPELWQEIFSYLDLEGVLAARSVSADWNQLITGFRQAGVVGVENKPIHIIDTQSWIKKEEIDFRNDKLKHLTPATIPSFAFYHLMGHVKNLPKKLWLYLPGTQVYTLNLGNNQIGYQGVIELAKALPGTRVHTLYLHYNQIRDVGARELAKALPRTQVHTIKLHYSQIGAEGARELVKTLPRTQVHTLYLEGNQIGDAGASELAKALPGTRMHTLNLSCNRIGAAGASELAKALPNTCIHTLSLYGNQIGDAGARELAKALPATHVHTLHLGDNQIEDAGALELAKVLTATQVHTIDLRINLIGAAIQQLLKTQYPHNKWDGGFGNIKIGRLL